MEPANAATLRTLATDVFHRKHPNRSLAKLAEPQTTLCTLVCFAASELNEHAVDRSPRWTEKERLIERRRKQCKNRWRRLSKPLA